MASGIQKLLVAAAIPAFVIGCGAVGQQEPSPTTFSQVLSDCNEGTLLYTRAEIASLVDFVEIDYADGYPYSTEMEAVLDACIDFWGFGTEEAADCMVCGRAAVNYVYE